jgi:uncharacterized protein YhfF
MIAQELWDLFSKRNNINDRYEAWAFCGGGSVGDLLAGHVIEGTKTSTSSSYISYQTANDPIPCAGDYSVILYDNGDAACIIRTTKITLTPFDEVPERHAYLEGDGDRSLALWREIHRDAFKPDYDQAGLPFDEHGLCVLEEFELVFTPPV